MKTKIFLLSVIVTFAVSMNSNVFGKPKKFDYGKVKDSIYTNSYFDFQISIPTGWIIQSKEQMADLTEKGKKLVAGDDENLQAALETADINVANLLCLFQYELGSPVAYNASMMIVAENMKNSPGIKTGSDYLFHTRKIMMMSQLKYDSLSENFEKKVISGTDFYTMTARINYLGIDIKQDYYSTVMNGFTLSFIISYVSDEQKEILLQCINSLKFGN